MDLALAGRVALVTGSTRGLGFAAAQALAAAGARVAINGRDAAACEVAARRIVEAGGDAQPFAADVTDADAVAALVAAVAESFGSLEILVNNAGVAGRHLGRPVDATSVRDWDIVLASHARSTFLCMHHAIPWMKRAGWGRIVNTSSIHASAGRPGVAHYAAAKAAVVALGRVAAKELGPFGITVNTVAPGFIETEMVTSLPPSFAENVSRQNPLGRLGQPDEVAAVVAFLCSPQAAYVNGCVVAIDGGRQDYAW